MAAKIFLTLPGNIKMPALGLGTWQAKEPAVLEAAINKALEIGYRHIDTAFAYQNEAVIGNVLKKWFDSGKLKREDLFITTKLPLQGIHPDRVETFIKKSLANLQLDYVDLYLVHFAMGCEPKADGTADLTKPIPKNDHVALWKKMEEQVDAGRAKTIGLSNFSVAQIQNILKSARIKPANLQIELHPLFQQKELVEFCKKNGITVVAYSPLGSPGANDYFKEVGFPEVKLPNIVNNPVFKKMGEKYKKTPAQVALRFLVQLGVAPIPKSVNPKRLEENINIFDFVIDDQDFKELLKLDQGPAARLATFEFLPEVKNHPDYPFNK